LSCLHVLKVAPLRLVTKAVCISITEVRSVIHYRNVLHHRIMKPCECCAFRKQPALVCEAGIGAYIWRRGPKKTSILGRATAESAGNAAAYTFVPMLFFLVRFSACACRARGVSGVSIRACIQLRLMF
jgi:hypothetical protein